MGRKMQLSIMVLLLIGLAGCKKANTDIFYNRKYVKEIKVAREKAGSYFFRNLIPGGNLAIGVKGELIYSEGIGQASRELEVKATRQTKFRVGNLTQVFTNAIYQKLVQEGLLNPDSSVRAYYPQFPEKQYPVSLRNLANEMAGIRPPLQNDDYRGGINNSLENGLVRFANDSLIAPPAFDQVPSIYNYNLLGMAMEKATGKSYNALFKAYLTDTLHLENTVLDNPLATIKNRSACYELNIISQVVNGMFYDLRQNAPSEGALSCAEDLVKFGNTLLFSGYFDGVRDSIFTPVQYADSTLAQMANSWIIVNDRKGRLFYGRQGNVPGGCSSLLIYPKEQIVVAVTCNLNASVDDTPVFEMAAPFLESLENKNTTEDAISK